MRDDDKLKLYQAALEEHLVAYVIRELMAKAPESTACVLVELVERVFDGICASADPDA